MDLNRESTLGLSSLKALLVLPIVRFSFKSFLFILFKRFKSSNPNKLFEK